MKRVLLTICLSLATIWSVGAMAENVAVVDMQTIFRSSPQIKQINAALNKQFSARKSNIIAMTKKLRTEVQQFKKNQSVMSAKNLKDFRSKITTQGIQLRQMQAKFQQDVATAQNKQMQTFIATVKKAVQKIAMRKKLDVVLSSNSLLYSNNKLDITPSVLAALKK